MFSVGIFSTHLPYIAFVFFYVFFFLFGIQKASAGEFSDKTTIKIHSAEITADVNYSPDTHESWFGDYDVNKLQLFEFKFFANKIRKIPPGLNNYILWSGFYPAMFCRPPPLN